MSAASGVGTKKARETLTRVYIYNRNKKAEPPSQAARPSLGYRRGKLIPIMRKTLCRQTYDSVDVLHCYPVLQFVVTFVPLFAIALIGSVYGTQ